MKKAFFAASLLSLCAMMISCNPAFISMMESGSGETAQSKYLVVFNKNGGNKAASPSRKAVTRPANTIGFLPAPPERKNYTFSGWNTSADGSGTVFNEATIVRENCIVYAQWQQN